MAIVNLNYGHHGGGKLYSYNDPKGTHRAGDEVMVNVTHPKTKKTYKTMGVIRSTHGAGTQGTKDTKDFLKGKGINLKTVLSGHSLRELPGFQEFNKSGGYTLKDWQEYSALKKEEEINKRVFPGMVINDFKNIYRLSRQK